MNTLNNVLESFLCIIKNTPLYSTIITIFLGGSLAEEKQDTLSDIDLIIICEDKKGTQLYDEIRKIVIERKMQITLDVKIVELNHIKRINNENSAPFFFHFVGKAKILHGRDLRKNFKLSKSVCNKSIYSIIDNIEKIKEIFYSYNKKQLAEVLLFENARKLAVIYELLSSNIEKDNYKSKKNVKQIYGKKLQLIRIQAKKQRSWLSLFCEKGKKDEMGFDLISLRKKRGEEKKSIAKDDYFDNITRSVINLGEKCLDLIEY